MFNNLKLFLTKTLFPIISDPFKIFAKKDMPVDELRLMFKYQTAIIDTINKDFQTPNFNEKFLRPADIPDSLSQTLSSLFRMDQIRPDYPPLQDFGELVGYEKILGMIDCSGEQNTRDFGLVFGRRGLYVRNINNKTGKLKNGAFVPYQKFEVEFPKLLPDQNRDTNKATVLKIAYGCSLDISSLNECISNSQIVNIFETIIGAIKFITSKNKTIRIKI